MRNQLFKQPINFLLKRPYIIRVTLVSQPAQKLQELNRLQVPIHIVLLILLDTRHLAHAVAPSHISIDEDWFSLDVHSEHLNRVILGERVFPRRIVPLEQLHDEFVVGLQDGVYLQRPELVFAPGAPFVLLAVSKNVVVQ